MNRHQEKLWRSAILIILLALALTLSSAWDEITIDNETYYLVPSSEIQPNMTIKGIFYPNFSSNETNYFTSRVLTPGTHTLRFQFGNETELAHNWATELTNFKYRRPVTITYTGPGEVNTTQLVGWWHFDENTGNQTNDSSGFGNHGTCHNSGGVCNWTTGKFSYGVKFDGVNDYVDCGNSQSLNITDKITIEAWMNPSADGWKYKKPITLNGSTSDLTNYQVKVIVDYDSDMQTDFDDLRFYDISGNSLNYWLENYTASTNATVWVKVPSIPTGGTTIYIYYGNPSASSASNGTNTFEFFDDFDDGKMETIYGNEEDNGNYENVENIKNFIPMVFLVVK